MNKGALPELEVFLNSGTKLAFILGQSIQKGLFGRVNQYQLRVHPNDHPPAHFHVMHGSERLGSYSIIDGSPIKSSNPRLDRVVAGWYERPGNQALAREEWERNHGENQ